MVRIVANHINSPIGSATDANMSAVLSAKSAIRLIEDTEIWPEPFYGAAYTSDQWKEIEENERHTGLTRLEALMAGSIENVLQQSGIDLKNEHSQLIVSTTKGNIDLLASEVKNPDESLLYHLSGNLQRYFKTARPVLLVSNACTSGLLAIINGARMLESEMVHDVVVCGGDLLTRFTLSGFQSFQAVSSRPCRPYDSERDGISLGEAVGAVAMTISEDRDFPAYISGATANDANHISGPSRTGEGLFQCVQRCFEETDKRPGMISTHGTATMYNDEMECQAFNRLQLENTPLHSLKGIYGHTLGAAGVIETILALRAMKQQQLLPSVGYQTHGVTLPLNVTKEASTENYQSALKTSSGFGGSNAAALFSL